MKIARVSFDNLKFLTRRLPVTVRKLKKVSFKLGAGAGYVTSNSMGRAVRQFEKEVSFKFSLV